MGLALRTPAVPSWSSRLCLAVHRRAAPERPRRRLPARFLLAEAYSEQGDPALRKADQVKAAAGVLGPSGTWRNRGRAHRFSAPSEACRRRSRCARSWTDAPRRSERLDDVEGEAVVIVDHQHPGVSSSLLPGDGGKDCGSLAPGFIGLGSRLVKSLHDHRHRHGHERCRPSPTAER